MPAEPTHLAARISELVAGASGAQIKGTELAAQIKDSFPTLAWSEYGCLNMRQFIDKNVPGVIVAGRAGMDYLYGVADHHADGNSSPDVPPIRESNSDSAEAAVKLDIRIWWPPFAGPNSPYTLFANIETGERRTIAAGERRPEGDTWVEVPRCDLQFFRDLAREFVTTLRDENEKSVLLAGIERGTGPQSEFYQAVLRLGLREAWNSFRQGHIIRRFVTTLQDLSIPFRPRLSSASNGTRALTVAQPIAPAVTRQSIPAAAIPKGREDRLRRIALGAVARMSLHDLRGLHLPLGDVLDALDE